MSLATDLWAKNQPLAQACLQNPFVQGLADGSLTKAKFAYYVGQDAFFSKPSLEPIASVLLRLRMPRPFGCFMGWSVVF